MLSKKSDENGEISSLPKTPKKKYKNQNNLFLWEVSVINLQH
jgi:hypothetical protein